MIASVSHVIGTSGQAKNGSEAGRVPMSPTVLTSSRMAIEITDRTTIAISGDGIAVVRRGRR